MYLISDYRYVNCALLDNPDLLKYYLYIIRYSVASYLMAAASSSMFFLQRFIILLHSKVFSTHL